MDTSSYSRPQMRPPGRPIGDLRTPVAWRQREYNLNQQQQLQQHQHMQFQGGIQQTLPQQLLQPHDQRARRGVSSSLSPPVSSTDTTGGEDEEERGADGDESSELDTSVSGDQQRRLQQNQQRHRHRYNRIHQLHRAAYKSQTMRSTRSVPALDRASWPDGRSSALMPICPVHGGYNSTMQRNQHQHQHHIPMPAYLSNDPYINGAPTMRRAGSMFDLRPPSGAQLQLVPHHYSQSTSPIMCGSLHPPVMQPIGYAAPVFRTLERNKKTSHYGSMRSLHSLIHGRPTSVMTINPSHSHPLPGPPAYNLPPMPPAHLLPPGMRPRPLVVPAGVEPLPIRDPTKSKMAAIGLPNSNSGIKGKKSMEVSGHDVDYIDGKQRCHCCRGPALKLIWFIVIIVTVGVVLGVILGSIYG